MTRIEKTLFLAFGIGILVPVCARAQWMLTKEQMTAYTAMNPYERFPDGRPKVPEALLERVKGLVIEEAWGAVRQGCGAGRGGGGNAGRGGANAGRGGNTGGGNAVGSGNTGGGGGSAGRGPADAAGGGCFPNQYAGDWKILNPGKRL